MTKIIITHANQVAVSRYLPLESLDLDHVERIEPGQYGLLFEGIEGGLLIVGNAAELRATVGYVGSQWGEIDKHSSKMLTLDDIVLGAGAMPICPKCGTQFNPQGFKRLGMLLDEIGAHLATHDHTS